MRKSYVNDESFFVTATLKDSNRQETYRKSISPHTEWQFNPDENDVYIEVSRADNGRLLNFGDVSDLYDVMIK